MPMSPYVRRLRECWGPELLELPSASVILRDAQGRVLLVRHAEGVWTTPGGAIEPLEAPADAAVREAWEETGLDVELIRVLGVYGGPDFVVRYAGGDETSYVMIFFEARIRGGRPRPDGEETFELAWFDPDGLDGVPVPEWLAEVLADAVRPERGTHFRAPTWRPPDAGDPARQAPAPGALPPGRATR